MDVTAIKDFITIDDTNNQKNTSLRPVIKNLLILLGGFFLMNPFVLCQLSPFAVSLVATSKKISTAFACAGAILGSIVFFDSTMAVRYIATSLLCMLINMLCSRFLDKETEKYSSYINSFVSVAVIGTGFVAATGFSGEEFITVLCESLLCVGGTFAFGRTYFLFEKRRDVSRFTTIDTVCNVMTAFLILMPFAKYTIFEFSPVCMIISFSVLASGRLKSGTGGAVIGICAGIATGISGEITFMSVGYAFAGLLCGELSRKSKFYCCAGYITPIIVSAVVDGTLGAYTAILEGIVACVAMLLIPDRLFVRLSERINAPTPIYIKSDSGKVLTKRLNNASDAIAQISNCVDTVQRSLNPLTQPKLNQAITTCWDKVCSECDLRSSCRDEIKHPRPEDITRIAQALKDSAPLDKSRFPKGFSSSCYCFDEMKEAISNKYLSFVACQGAQGKVSQMQGLMSDQFKSMADILSEIACEFDEDVNVNTQTADICANEAKECGLDVIRTNSYLDKFGRIFINLNVRTPSTNFNVTKLTENISNSIGAILEIPQLEEHESDCTFRFRQKISFCVDIGAFSRSMDDEQVCGDYYQCFRDGNARQILILSDGMGTGTRAAVDSAMAAELFSKLVKSGLSFDCALPIANTALLVKSDDESLATLDVVCIDLYSGKTDFMKAGAAATFVRHKGNVATLEQASLPIGILRDISFSKATAKLEKGDLILMISDGVSGDNIGWIQQELKLWDSDNPDELAKYIVNNACERRLGKHRDDMTAIAIIIK